MKKEIGILIIAGILLCGCGRSFDVIQKEISTENTGIGKSSTESGKVGQETSDADRGTNGSSAGNKADGEFENQEDSSAEPEPEILDFVDVYGESYQTVIHPDVEKHTYDLDAFSRNGNAAAYTGDERYTYRLGIDVSYHQGSVNWEKVKAAGFDFAFLRIGYRGYGKEGSICLDKQFFQNIKGAKAAGIDTGVYFFSQAVNEDEAREEAEFVLEQLKGYELQLPIVYDPESILDEEARTDNVTGEQFTKNTIVFCELVKAAGYQPMIYSNMLWEAFQYDLKQLAEYPIWYADYEPLPQTPYQFEFWQYTNTASIDGIDGVVDLNIQLIPADEM